MSLLAQSAWHGDVSATLASTVMVQEPDPSAPRTSLARLGLPDYESTTEEALLTRICHADIIALGVLYSRHAPRVYTLLHQLGLGDEKAEDVLVKAFLDIWTTSLARKARLDGSFDRVIMRAVLHGLAKQELAHDIDETYLRNAFREIEWSKVICPTAAARRRLMTRLGHPGVEPEPEPAVGTSSKPRNLRWGLLTAAGMIVLTSWWLWG